MRPITQILTPLESAVLATLAYTDQFGFPLRKEEILVRCLIQGLPKKRLSLKEVTHALQTLQDKKLIAQGETLYFLIGREKLISDRKEQEAAAEKKKPEVDQVVAFISQLPWVRALYLTGSQAMNSATLQSDIDFMIITDPLRMWLTRIVVSCYAQLQGKRRSWNHEEPGSWCFNLWIDTQHLGVEAQRQSSYLAYEVFQAKLLWATPAYTSRFIQENTWITEYIRGDDRLGKREATQSPEISSRRWWSSVLDATDACAWWVQSWYMKRHQTTERVGRGFAFFHPRDTRTVIAEGWQVSLERCLPKQQALEILQTYVSRTS